MLRNDQKKASFCPSIHIPLRKDLKGFTRVRDLTKCCLNSVNQKEVCWNPSYYPYPHCCGFFGNYLRRWNWRLAWNPAEYFAYDESGLVQHIQLLKNIVNERFGWVPDQLLTRTIQLRPQALTVDTEAVSFRSEYRRKVDLSNYHVYAQPLVTVRQLQDWVANTIRKIPWYKDDVKHTGFTYDMQQSRYGVHLLPPTVDPATVGTLGRKFLGGVFKWYGTNGGRQIKWANPLRLRGLVRVVTSDVDLNQDPHTVGRLLANPVLEQRHISRKTLGSKKPKHQTTSHTSIRQHAVLIRPDREGAFPNESASWIAFDLGMYIHLTHYLIQVPLLGDRWPHLTDWQVQGSTSGILWEVLSEHHVNPAGDPKAYWGPKGEKTWCLQTSQTGTGIEMGWRFIRIQALPGCGQNKRLQSSMSLRGIEFFGIVTKLITTQDKFAQTEAAKYLAGFRTEAFVVPNLPVAICDDIFSDCQEKNKCDRWQLLEENALMKVRFSDDHSRRHHAPRGQPPIIGKVLDDLKDGYVTVRWLSDPDEMCEASEYKSVAKSYCMGAFQSWSARQRHDPESGPGLVVITRMFEREIAPASSTYEEHFGRKDRNFDGMLGDQETAQFQDSVILVTHAVSEPKRHQCRVRYEVVPKPKSDEALPYQLCRSAVFLLKRRVHRTDGGVKLCSAFLGSPSTNNRWECFYTDQNGSRVWDLVTCAHDNRYELRLPSDIEIQSRLQMLYRQKQTGIRHYLIQLRI
ncbi:hypothetical protein CLF_110347 [Clonorchis sinensis]|uniref:Uncharacterized protein n=1 Tax=Clonorchis sinensis TaxID=79923 RepID=G7YKK1_CLOSI|nr:hypothetical protein CLF_110347 [Clonorchis sinensis]